MHLKNTLSLLGLTKKNVQSCSLHLFVCFFFCAFDSPKFKHLISFACLISLKVLYELACQNIHEKI